MKKINDKSSVWYEKYKPQLVGDLILPVPPHVLKQMGWKEGDELDIGVGEDGRIFLKKVFK